MERRTFLSIVGGAGLAAGAPADGLLLRAFAAESLPESAMLHDPPDRLANGIFEVRQYEGARPSLELLARHGIRTITDVDGALLFWFPDLAVRGASWSALAADPEWQKAPLNVTKISLYKAA